MTRTTLLAGLALALTACGGPRSATPQPTKTPFALFQVRPLATATPAPTAPPTPTPLPPELALATLSALIETLTPAAPPTPPLPSGTAVSIPPVSIRCEIPRTADSFTLMPAADAPEEARTAWADQTAPALTAEVREHDAEARTYTLRAVEPAADDGFVLSYAGEPLPIEPGKTYRFTVHQDPAGGPPSGSGLKVEDEAGLVFLGVAARETEGADLRVLGGDRGGLAVRQLPTTCTQTETNACGYELRAAPIEVRRGDQALTLSAGETGRLATDPPYLVQVLTSHYRRWLGDIPCADPTDWVLGYRIARATASDGAATATP